MAGRLVWIAAGGAAILAGIAVQSGDFIDISSDSHDRAVVEDRVRDEIRDARREAREARREARRIGSEERERLAEVLAAEEADRLEITTDGDGNIVVGGDTGRELASAVGEYIRAEIALAMVDEGDSEAQTAAQERRDEADERVNELKDQIEEQAENDEAFSDQNREEMRQRIRLRIRDLFGRD